MFMLSTIAVQTSVKSFKLINNMDRIEPLFPPKAYPKQEGYLSLLNDLRKSRTDTDIIIRIGTKDFYAHKVILTTASPFFRSYLSKCWDIESNPSEHNHRIVVLETSHVNPDYFEDILEFIYCAHIEINPKN